MTTHPCPHESTSQKQESATYRTSSPQRPLDPRKSSPPVAHSREEISVLTVTQLAPFIPRLVCCQVLVKAWHATVFRQREVAVEIARASVAGDCVGFECDVLEFVEDGLDFGGVRGGWVCSCVGQ